MPADTEFTLSLFDSTASAGIPSAGADRTLANFALLGWNAHALQAAAKPDENDPDDAGFRQFSRQRTLFKWQRLGYGRRRAEGGIDSAVHWVRLDGRFGTDRADRSGLPAISLSRLRQTVQRAQ